MLFRPSDDTAKPRRNTKVAVTVAEMDSKRYKRAIGEQRGIYIVQKHPTHVKVEG